MVEKITLGISTCLLGEPVRYDGGHKLNRYLRDVLGQYVTFVPVCPEVECGLSTPRESMRLVGDPGSPRLVTTRTKADLTARMLKWARQRVRELEAEQLCGFVFMSNSPSSGMERVKVYNEHGVPSKSGVGLFARAFMEHFPLVPVEDQGRLNDPLLRENFIERIFVMRRWRELLAQGRSRRGLVQFHTEHKLLIMAHSPKLLRTLGSLVAGLKGMPLAQAYDDYLRTLCEALALKSTVKKNTNVLMHLMGYFRTHLTADERQELLEIITNYHRGYVPLIVPVTLVNHFVRKYDEPYLKQQCYLNPHPIDLKLRNHA